MLAFLPPLSFRLVVFSFHTPFPLLFSVLKHQSTSANICQALPLRRPSPLSQVPLGDFRGMKQEQLFSCSAIAADSQNRWKVSSEVDGGVGIQLASNADGPPPAQMPGRGPGQVLWGHIAIQLQNLQRCMHMHLQMKHLCARPNKDWVAVIGLHRKWASKVSKGQKKNGQ